MQRLKNVYKIFSVKLYSWLNVNSEENALTEIHDIFVDPEDFLHFDGQLEP